MIMFLYQIDRLAAINEPIADKSRSAISRKLMPELGVLHPVMDRVSAAVHLVEVFDVVRPVPLVRQIVKACGFGK